jgi:hypothetical protein
MSIIGTDLFHDPSARALDLRVFTLAPVGISYVRMISCMIGMSSGRVTMTVTSSKQEITVAFVARCSIHTPFNFCSRICKNWLMHMTNIAMLKGQPCRSEQLIGIFRDLVPFICSVEVAS